MLPNLLLLIAIATGIIVTEPSLSTDRVLRHEAVEQDDENPGVHSYFWEDPLMPLKTKSDVEKAPEPIFPYGLTPPPEVDTRELDQVIDDDSDDGRGSLVLFIGMDGGVDPAEKERRIRTRMAVASALAGRASMLINLPSKQLKPCLIPIRKKDKLHFHPASMEVFEGLNLTDQRWFKVKIGKVHVIYLDESKITPSPAHMAELVQASGESKKPEMRFAYIGLCRSERLSAFLLAATRSTIPPDPWAKPQITVYSPIATAEDEMIWRHNQKKVPGTNKERIEVSKTDSDSFKKSYRFVSGECHGLLHRVGADDGQVCRALISELRHRGIPSNDGPAGSKNDAVLILADLDRYHSRLLSQSFCRAWQENYPISEKQEDYGKFILSEELVKQVRVIHYSEALDGMPSSGAGSQAQSSSTGKSEATAKVSTNPGGKYAAEGSNHFDTLRRLPARLRDLEHEDGVRYRAIGLLGSDVHDKLLLLKALKPVFPGAVFFTNDLDARMWQGEERSASMNLLVAGAFGLSLDSRLQGSVPPFRSSYQTATYLACLDAVDFKANNDIKNEKKERIYPDIQFPNREVELHEVGRSGHHLLSYWRQTPPAAAMDQMSHRATGRPTSTDHDLEYYLIGHRLFQLVVILITVVLLLQTVWPHWRARFFDARGPVTRTTDERCAVGVGFIVLIFGGLALWTPNLSCLDGSSREAQELFSGISAVSVVATNFLVIAIGAVMIFRLAQMRRPIPPYPFSRENHPPTDDTNRAQQADEGSNTWRQPAWSDFTAWLCAGWKWLRKRDYEKEDGFLKFVLAEEEQRRFQEINNYTPEIDGENDHQRIKALKDKLKNRLISTYLRERLVTSAMNIALRVTMVMLLAGLLFCVLQQIYPNGLNTPVPPSVRGLHFRCWFAWSDGLAKCMLAIVATVAMDRQVSMALGLHKLCNFLQQHGQDGKSIAPYDWLMRPDICYDPWKQHEKSILQPGTGNIGLWEMPLLRLAAQRFRAISPLMVMPFVLLFIILMSRHAVFENITFPHSEIILFAFFLLGPLAAGAAAQYGMAKTFDQVQERLRKGARYTPDTKAPEPAAIREKFFKTEMEVFADLQSRTRYKLLENPLFKAVLLPLGGLGVLELSSILASVVK